MAAMVKRLRMAGYGIGCEEATEQGGVRFAQSSMLSELPGVLFGLITIAYLAASLLALV